MGTMQPAPNELADIMKQGLAAMRAGDPQRGRDMFSRATGLAPGHAPAWVGLALACDALKDGAGKLIAVDRALTIDPRNLRALILKADHFVQTGDLRGAAPYYRMATDAAPAMSQLPPFMQDEVRRARAFGENYTAQYEASLREALAARGFDVAQTSARFVQSLDILFGRKKIYFQQPLSYFLPELPQIQFYDRALFPWLDKIEAATSDIRRELEDVMREPAKFTPYVEGKAESPLRSDRNLLNNPDWSAFYLWKNGSIVPENAQRCPKTLAAVEGAPLTRIAGRAPSILFSQLRPGARIPPHTGFLNTRLICHLPLIVPPNCTFRVGNETRTWREGEAWVFDDSIEHEAHNGSDQTRVILIFDVWRPEVTADERGSIAAMLEAIDAQGVRQPDWEG
jgi:aspartate beta-hydroxylase